MKKARCTGQRAFWLVEQKAVVVLIFYNAREGESIGDSGAHARYILLIRPLRALCGRDTVEKQLRTKLAATGLAK